jgi:shikimate dehydrogenase
MKKYGLIGYPISHSLSPALFKAAYEGTYDYDLLEGEFDEAYQSFLDHYDAVNVTAPYKEVACTKAQVLSPECEMIGACNVLKKTAEGILAVNTDYIAVMKLLIQHQTPGMAPLVVVVGCGGAGKAAACAACELGNEVIMLNRNQSKADEFVERLSAQGKGYRIKSEPLSEFRKWFAKAGVIIYAVPTLIDGLSELRKCDLKGGLFRKMPKVIVEANYKDPAFTQERLSQFRTVNHKIEYVSGREWLLGQAVEAYGLFTGEEPNIQKMIKVL